MKHKHAFIPEVLGSRSGLPHNNYVRNGLEPVTLSGVSVEFGTPSKPHIHNVPSGDGAIARKMRRFGLIRSRFQLPNYAKQAKSWKVQPLSAEAASNAVCILGYRQAYKDDPTVGTMSPEPVINLLNEGSVSRSIVTHLLSYSGTQYLADVLDGMRDEDLALHIRDRAREISNSYLESTEWDRYYSFINHKNANRYRYKRCMSVMGSLASVLEYGTNDVLEQHTKRNNPSDGKPQDAHSGSKPEVSITDDSWDTLVVAKPPLEIPHTGKLGRRFIPSDYGKYPQLLHRELTDPYERIFRRKTRALGGIVVIDCSGSMSLSEQDIHRLLKASSGSTVICYSSHLYSYKTGSPNAWVVARNGRMVRQLPDFPGGNGVDAPVLKWAVDNYRRGSRTPVIWVSDGMVTGKRDSHTETLVAETKSVTRRYGIVRVEEVNEAIKLLNKLQGKAR